MRSRGYWVGASAAAALAAAVFPALSPEAIWTAGLFDVATLLAAACAFAGARHLPEPRRRTWLLVAGGGACVFAGNVIWDTYERVLHQAAPLPSLADVAYIAAYPLLTGATLRLLRHETGLDQINALLDAGVVALAAGLIVWEPLLLGAGGDANGAFVAGAYPVLSIFVIALLSMVVAGGGASRANALFLAGLGVFFVGNVIYLVLESRHSYATGGWPDPLFALAPVLLAAAPWVEHERAVKARPRHRAAATPAAVAIAALLALSIDFGLTDQGELHTYEVSVHTGLRVVLLAFVGIRLLRHFAHTQRLVRALDESSRRLAMVVDSTADAVIFASPTGVVLEWNAAAEELFDVARERAIGTNALDHFARRGDARQIANTVATSGDRVTELSTAIEISGRVVPITFRIARVIDDDDRLAGYVSVARDDTRRLFARHARKTLAHLDPDFAVERFADELSAFIPFNMLSLASVQDESFRELSRVMNTTEDGFVAVNRDELLEGHLRDFGFTGTEAPYLVVGPEELGTYGDHVDTSNAKAVISLPLREPRRGNLRGFLTFGFTDPSAATTEHAEALARVGPDIAQSVENMLLYEEQRLAAERLEELSGLRDAFLAMVAHEIRAPLSAIGAAATVLRDRRDRMTSQQAQEMLRGIATSAGHLTRLTGDLLDAGRGGEGRFPCRLVDMDDAGAVVAEAASRAAGGRLDRLDIHVDPAVALRGDPDRLGQIVTNLVTNALKFTDGAVEVTLTTREGGAVLTVADHGEGIPEADAHLVFQRFARRAHTAARAGGAGLGLYITRELVAAHGGTISHRPTSGGGATFEVCLPVQTRINA